MTEKLSVCNHNTEVQLCTRTAAAIARDGQIDREQQHTLGTTLPPPHRAHQINLSR